MSYDIFAHYYDEIMDQSVYDSWLLYVEKYTAGKSGLDIMELACGTGKIAVDLTKKGHQVTGVDLSDEMLSLAYNRMQEEGVKLSSFISLRIFCAAFSVSVTVILKSIQSISFILT